MNRLSNWILIGSNAYDEYTFVPWLNKNVYRRTVDLSRVCLQKESAMHLILWWLGAMVIATLIAWPLCVAAKRGDREMTS